MGYMVDRTFRFIPLTAHVHVVLGAAVFEANVPMGATRVMVQVLTQSVRYTLDGTNPTAAFGFQLTASNDPIILDITEKTKLKFIGNGGVLEYQFSS